MLLGRHEITGTLGRGASGVVYSARSPEGRDVAIKVLMGRSSEARARFEREKRILAGLGEGFVPLLESGESRDGPYIVMPLLAGGTLRERLGSGGLDPGTVRALGARLADALGRAHAAGIVHRDVKPENILFTESGEPLVADLGLAKHFDRTASATSVSLSRDGDLRGTAGYMAPEQVTNAREADARSDVFSLSAVLYEALAGEPPFRAESLVELLALLEHPEVVPLRSRRAAIPRDLALIVERGLSARPEDRFQDGAALAAALRRSARRSPLPLAGLAAVIGVALVTVLSLGLLRATPAAAPSPPPPPPRRSPPPTEPADARAFFERARARAARGETKEAIADYGKGLERQPDAEAFVARGLLFDARGDNDHAYDDYSAAMELAPGKNASAANLRGTVLTRKGLFERARADFDEAIRIDPRMKLAWLNRGAANHWLKRLDAALADYSHAIDLDPDLGDAWLGRGKALFEKQDYVEAVPQLETATRLAPRDAESWQMLGAARFRSNDVTGARAAIDRAVELDPRRAIALELRGIVRSHQDDFDGAIADQERAESLSPAMAKDGNLSVYLKRRADKRAAAGDTRGAIADLERFFQVAPPGSPLRDDARASLERLTRAR